MPFTLPLNALTNLNLLREKYQTEKQVDLSAAPSMIGMPIFFGGVDVAQRNKQIEFLEKIHAFLKPNLFREEEIATPQEWQANLTASRVMLAATLFVKSQIESSKRRSVLYRLLEDDLGITSENYLDDEDQEICFLAAKRLMTSAPTALDDVNAALRKAKLKTISETDWNQFRTFVCEKTAKRTSSNPYSDYPITSVTQRLFGAAFAYTGATVGMLSGDVVSHSTKGLSAKTQLTAFIGSTLLVFGSAGPAGVALFAPAIAERLISAFCSISLAHALGIGMGIVGQGVGIGIGMPMDLACHLLSRTCKTISSYALSSKKSLLSGTRIKDGVTILNGIAIELIAADQMSGKYVTQIVEIRDNKLYIDDKLIEIPETGIQLPPEVIAKLRATLKAPTPALSTITEAPEEESDVERIEEKSAVATPS